MKYDWDNRTGEKPAKKVALFPMALAAAALFIVVAYLLIGSGPSFS